MVNPLFSLPYIEVLVYIKPSLHSPSISRLAIVSWGLKEENVLRIKSTGIATTFSFVFGNWRYILIISSVFRLVACCFDLKEDENYIKDRFVLKIFPYWLHIYKFFNGFFLKVYGVLLLAKEEWNGVGWVV